MHLIKINKGRLANVDGCTGISIRKMGNEYQLILEFVSATRPLPGFYLTHEEAEDALDVIYQENRVSLGLAAPVAEPALVPAASVEKERRPEPPPPEPKQVAVNERTTKGKKKK